MEKQFIALTNNKDRFQFLQQNKKLTNQDVEAIYRKIHSLNDDSYELIEKSLQINFGNILINQDSINDQVQQFKKIIDSTKDLDQLSIYVKFIESKCQTEIQKQFFKEVGFQGEKLIMEFRKQGNILQKLHLDKEDIKYQRQTIQLINKLCPKDLSFNPELFQLMLLPFKYLNLPEQRDLLLLDQLAQVLLLQCKGEGQTNQNQVHDWLAILTGIIQQAHEGKNIGLLLLLKKVLQKEYLNELLVRHKNYMLLNYFNNYKDTISIFKGLIQHSISPENILFIKKISQFLLEFVETYKSKHYAEILQQVYRQFILIDILGNIQTIYYERDILDLLYFYIIGMSQIDKQAFENSLDLLNNRLQLLFSLKFNTRDYITPKLQFLQNIQPYYNNLQQNDIYTKLYQNCQQKSQERNKIPSTEIYVQWNFSKAIDEQPINQNILDRDSKDFVGLENLTNTCFMNSILQSLYMTQCFRHFILQLKLTEQSLQLIPHQSQLSCLQKLFLLLTYQKQGYCSPYELKRQLREPYSNTNDQQDVGEFIHHFLEDLLEILPKQLQPTIEKMFFGQQRSVLECFNCPKRFPNYGQFEKFLGLDLHFNDEEQADLYDMIKKVQEREQIEFYCDKCKQKTENNYKSLQLVQLPSILFMTIHRFTYNPISQTMNKVLTKVPFRFVIDFREIFNNKNLSKDDSIYHLYAFIVHLGKNSQSGHYMCYARQLNQPDIWIVFDDTMITSQEINSEQLDEQLIVQEAPYILFYQNQSGKQLKFNI